MQINLPSGLVGDVRKIRGAEITTIAEQADGEGAADGGFSALLGGCWLDTVDPGPYPDSAFSRSQGGPAKPVWSKVLKGDLLTGVVFLRQLSLTEGDVYAFDVQCEECRKNIQWELLLSNLPLRVLPEESAARLRAGEPFETTVAGRKVLFDLQTLAQEEPIVRLMRKQRRQKGTIVDVLAGQTRHIDGVGSSAAARWEWLAQLSMGELFDLRAAMEEHDCGIETSVEVVCQNRQCQLQQEVNLPLGRRFFSPRRKRRDDQEEAPGEAATRGRLGSSGASSAASPGSGGGASARTSGGSSTGGAGTPG